ncbi:MAG TPA: hypothetical protein VE981_07590 [Planctomycetota bacterium]|nr:hypothetical protein [Planctomycetota bacterium]
MAVSLTGLLTLFLAADPPVPQPVAAVPAPQEARQEVAKSPAAQGAASLTPRDASPYALREVASQDLEQFRGGGAGLAVLVLIAIILPW